MAGGGPPRRGEGSRGSVNVNAKANAVGVGCVRCARAHLPFGLREAPAQSFVVAVGSAPGPPRRNYTILPERSAWKKNFTRVDKFLLTWQVSRVSDDGNAFRTGGARLGQLIGRASTIFCLADVAGLRVEQCAGEAAADWFSSPLRCAIDPGDDPGVYGAAICMFCPAVLPAMSIASSCSRAAVERVYRQKGPRLVHVSKKVRCNYI